MEKMITLFKDRNDGVTYWGGSDIELTYGYDEDALETGKRKENKKCNRGPNAMKLVFLLCACFLTLYFFLF